MGDLELLDSKRAGGESALMLFSCPSPPFIAHSKAGVPVTGMTY
jgi:hypothetical protein